MANIETNTTDEKEQILLDLAIKQRDILKKRNYFIEANIVEKLTIILQKEEKDIFTVFRLSLFDETYINFILSKETNINVSFTDSFYSLTEDISFQVLLNVQNAIKIILTADDISNSDFLKNLSPLEMVFLELVINKGIFVVYISNLMREYAENDLKKDLLINQEETKTLNEV